MEAIKKTFRPEERLKSHKLITALFQRGSGEAFMAYPLRVVYLPIAPEHLTHPDTFPTLPPVQIAVSVPKRAFKRAVDRNRLKRLIREAWRLHKHELYSKMGEKYQPIAMMLVYIAKEEIPFVEVEAGIKKLIRKL